MNYFLCNLVHGACHRLKDLFSYQIYQILTRALLWTFHSISPLMLCTAGAELSVKIRCSLNASLASCQRWDENLGQRGVRNCDTVTLEERSVTWSCPNVEGWVIIFTAHHYHQLAIKTKTSSSPRRIRNNLIMTLFAFKLFLHNTRLVCNFFWVKEFALD